MRGKLLSKDFLKTGIWETQEAQQLDDKIISDFKDKLQDVFHNISITSDFNEQVTEDKVIIPILQALGWPCYLRQQTASEKGRVDVPDILLLPDQESEEKALKEKRMTKDIDGVFLL